MTELTEDELWVQQHALYKHYDMIKLEKMLPSVSGWVGGFHAANERKKKELPDRKSTSWRSATGRHHVRHVSRNCDTSTPRTALCLLGAAIDTEKTLIQRTERKPQNG